MRVVTPQSAAPDDPALREAARVLDAGGVVALPTETVYGLCCRSAYKDAVARIFEIKDRPPEKRLPFLVPDASRLGDFTNDPPPRAVRLARRWWPGPLTLVVGPDPESVAVRVPETAVTRTVLRLAQGPVHGTSANLSGHEAATDAPSVVRAFSGRAAPDLVVDGGPCKVGRESTLVRVAPDAATSIIRIGALAPTDLLPEIAAKILVVCTGNTCRSPMAAALLKKALADALNVSEDGLLERGIDVSSAGVSAFDGDPASSGARRAASRRGLSLDRHASRPISALALDDYECVFGLTPEHVSTLRRRFNVAHASTLDPDGHGIADPFGGGDDDYEAAARDIEAAVARRVPMLLRLALPK